MRIEIPKPNESGSCPSSCPLFRHRETIGCAEFVKRPPLLGYVPGPSCLPGVYELVPVGDESRRLPDDMSPRDEVKALADDILLGRMMCSTTPNGLIARDEIHGRIDGLRAENERLRSALKAIAYACDGPGGNCGEFQCMIKIARAALKEVKP